MHGVPFGIGIRRSFLNGLDCVVFMVSLWLRALCARLDAEGIDLVREKSEMFKKSATARNGVHV